MLMHAPAARIGLIRPRQPQLACRHACPSIRPADGSITSRPRTAAQVDDRGRRPSRGPRMLHALHCTPLISQRNVRSAAASLSHARCRLPPTNLSIAMPCQLPSPSRMQRMHLRAVPAAHGFVSRTHFPQASVGTTVHCTLRNKRRADLYSSTQIIIL
jgi:hypothetical protein